MAKLTFIVTAYWVDMPYISQVFNNGIFLCGLPHILSVIHHLAEQEESGDLNRLNNVTKYRGYHLLKEVFAGYYALNNEALTWRILDKFISAYSFYIQELIFSLVLREFFALSAERHGFFVEDQSLNFDAVSHAFFGELGITIDIVQEVTPDGVVLPKLDFSSFSLQQRPHELQTHITIYRDASSTSSLYRLEPRGEVTASFRAHITQVGKMCADEALEELKTIHLLLKIPRHSITHPKTLLTDFVQRHIQYWIKICFHLPEKRLREAHNKALFKERSLDKLAVILTWLGREHAILQNSDMLLKLLECDKAKLHGLLNTRKPSLKKDQALYRFVFRDWDNLARIQARFKLLDLLESAEWIPAVVTRNYLLSQRSTFRLDHELIYNHPEPEVLLEVIEKLQPLYRFASMLSRIVQMDSATVKVLMEVLLTFPAQDITPENLNAVVNDPRRYHSNYVAVEMPNSDDLRLTPQFRCCIQ